MALLLELMGVRLELDMDDMEAVLEFGEDVEEAWLDSIDVVFSFGDGGSSWSTPKQSPGDGALVVDGLQAGESGLLGSSSLPGPIAPRPASCRFSRVT